jgi:DNA replication protein DnaC
MVDSERLTERINARIQERTAEEHAARASRVGRAPMANVVLAMAAKHGVDPSKLRHATDEEIARHDAQVQREWNERKINIQLARMPVAFRRAELPRTPAGVIAMQWVTDYRKGPESRRPLVIVGPTGTGKTYIAMALARLLLVEDVVPVTIVTAPDLMAALRPSAVSEHTDLDMMSFAVAPVLVLDDLGSEKMSEWTEEQLYRLADERSRNARPTIVTSNLDGAGLRARYGDRTVGRLFGGASLIKLDGADRRALPEGF